MTWNTQSGRAPTPGEPTCLQDPQQQCAQYPPDRELYEYLSHMCQRQV
eukprot:CAMPEP_0172840144 /NCGR_PEP_ID=MMETSP1075-20121228/29091_1 /TAXON_ID=2916 /ORGANISM="Ceratium fusus, Strain PA161109" /LENGTH=47 /DNA_ID= /DNA_START= /DNA_END= /DNA_ORIENTATION=